VCGNVWPRALPKSVPISLGEPCLCRGGLCKIGRLNFKASHRRIGRDVVWLPARCAVPLRVPPWSWPRPWTVAETRARSDKSGNALFAGLLKIGPSGLQTGFFIFLTKSDVPSSLNHVLCQRSKCLASHCFTGTCFVSSDPIEWCEILNVRKRTRVFHGACSVQAVPLFAEMSLGLKAPRQENIRARNNDPQWKLPRFT
jgi:hypothetical protein